MREINLRRQQAGAFYGYRGTVITAGADSDMEDSCFEALGKHNRWAFLPVECARSASEITALSLALSVSSAPLCSILRATHSHGYKIFTVNENGIIAMAREI